MTSLKNIILKTILTYSLSNREVFVEKVTAVLERYQNDDEKIKEISDFLFSALTDMKQNINEQDNISTGVHKGNEALGNDITELTKAIKELKEEIRNIRK